MDAVAGISANPSFQKASTSTFPAPVSLNSGSISLQDSQENLAGLTAGMPSTSYSLSTHQKWPQHQEQIRTDPIYSQKQETLLPGSQFNINFQSGTSVQLHSGLHPRSDKLSEHSSVHKPGNKHHGQVATTPAVIPQKMSLDKYREKRKLETLELDVREQYMGTEQQYKKHAQLQIASSSSIASPIKMKIPITNTEKPEKHMPDKKEKGLLKLRIPIPPTEKNLSKDDLKMKIKVSSSERHSSSDESSGKSKHSSPHVNKDHKEKHKEHSTNRHHGSAHKHSHSHSGGGGGGGSKHSSDGLTPAVLRSPVGLSSDGNSSSSGSSRKKVHSNDASHNHHSKMSKSSKSSGSSSSSSSVKQYVSSLNSVFNLPLPPPPPVTYQVGYGHLSTLVKLDKNPVENGPDASHEYSTNSQHMDYKDTFDMLDSLLSAQGMNM